MTNGRIRHLVLAAAAATVTGVAACAQTNAAPGSGTSAAGVDSTRLMQTIAVLAHDSMEGRATGTAGSRKAQQFLVSELQRRGVQPLGAGGYMQEFRMAGRQGADSVTGANIVGIIRGTRNPDRYIVVSAHYDHLGVRNGDVFNGADDNASGTAGILEVASWFAAHPPRNSVVIALFDAEERGLVGARQFVASGITPKDAVILNVNLDMVGRNVKNELYASGTARYPALLPYVQSAAARSGLKLLTGHDIEGTGGEDWTSQSDQGAFHRAGIPFLYFGEEDHPDYHKATDELPGIMPGFYVAAIRTILDVVKQIDVNPPAR